MPGLKVLLKSESEYEVILERGPTKLSYIAPTSSEALGEIYRNVWIVRDEIIIFFLKGSFPQLT